MENQEDRYHDTLPTILRELMEKHPATGDKDNTEGIGKIPQYHTAKRQFIHVRENTTTSRHTGGDIRVLRCIN